MDGPGMSDGPTPVNPGRCASLEELTERRDAIVVAWRAKKLDGVVADAALAKLVAVDDLGASWSWELADEFFFLIRVDAAGVRTVMEQQRLRDAGRPPAPVAVPHPLWIRVVTVVFVVAALAAIVSFWLSLRGT